jgi:hypothetical protein
VLQASRAVIFGRNDLVKDAPISRVALLVCRNTLMYMNADTQRNVLGRLYFALGIHGTLFLGHAEMLLSHGDQFTPLSLKHRIFRKTPGSHGGIDRYDSAAALYERHGDLSGLTTVRDLAFRANPVECDRESLILRADPTHGDEVITGYGVERDVFHFRGARLAAGQVDRIALQGVRPTQPCSAPARRSSRR